MRGEGRFPPLPTTPSRQDAEPAHTAGVWSAARLQLTHQPASATRLVARSSTPASSLRSMSGAAISDNRWHAVGLGNPSINGNSNVSVPK